MRARLKARAATIYRQARSLSLTHERQSRQLKNEYKRSLSIDWARSSDCAVVIHLYYTESWPVFSRKLDNLAGHAFDLYVTMPEKNRSFIPTILQRYPDARVIISPNRGRDVLPFLMVARKLYENGYVYVLKIHSKKSPHYEGGNDWFNGMIDSLLPDDNRLMDKVITTLEKQDTGVVGPEGQYMPLTINFPANGPHMSRVITKIYSQTRAETVLQQTRADWGFFAGTMFWLRLDAIEKILMAQLPIRSFESEKGQIDATLAHALERLFCLVPEIDGRHMYELRGGKINKIDYKTDNIPEWSDLYVPPRDA